MRLLQSSRGQPQCPSFPGCPQQLPGLSATPLPAAVAPLGSLAFSAALRSSILPAGGQGQAEEPLPEGSAPRSGLGHRVCAQLAPRP